MRWALVNQANIVVNVIEYNGTDPFIPPEGMVLRQVNDWVEMGMNADILEQDVPRTPPPDPAVEKQKRNNFYKNDLSIVALYNLALVTNPQLTLSDYLDSLESMRRNMPNVSNLVE